MNVGAIAAARRARCVRDGDAAREGQGRPDHGQPGRSCAPWGSCARLNKPLKVLGGGDLSTPLFVVADAFTASARTKIEGAGGSRDGSRDPGPPARGARRHTDRRRSAAARRRGRRSGRTRGRPGDAGAPAPREGQPPRPNRNQSQTRRPPRPPTRPRPRLLPRPALRQRPSRSSRTRSPRRRPRPANPRKPPCSNPFSTRSARRISGAGSCIVLGILIVFRFLASRAAAGDRPGRSSSRSSRTTRSSGCSNLFSGGGLSQLSIVGAGR